MIVKGEDKMKNVVILLVSIFFVSVMTANAQFDDLVKHVKDKAEQKANEKIDKTIDGKKDNSKNNNSNTNLNSNMAASSTQPPSIKTYQNYDFVPGDKIIFEDDFTADQNGEFPSHWDLDAGQAVVNEVAGKAAFSLTEGNYCRVYPLMKTKSYLTDPFTIEFDYYPNGSADGPILFLKYKDENGDDAEGNVSFDENGTVEIGYFSKSFSADYPNEDDNTFFNKWHHCAVIYKNNQLKCYVDQYRILVVPNLGVVPTAFGFGGIGDMTNPILITNVRAAAGGTMNMIGKKFTASKIVTHGITFDVDKADIKPQSMGTLNMIVRIMKNNPGLKFEVSGYTDNTGSSAHNVTLSQQRADAVKAELTSLGIEESRLTAKGFGDTKPIDSNDTPEGKANNRRVEFVKF